MKQEEKIRVGFSPSRDLLLLLPSFLAFLSLLLLLLTFFFVFCFLSFF